MSVLATNLKQKHGHWRMSMKDILTGDEELSSARLPMHSFSIENVTQELTRDHQFTEYEKHYAYYKDGDTEYVHFVGTVADLNLKLTIDVWTCYCEPLNENDEPPF